MAQITTVIPTYRRPHLLARAIHSALGQTYRDIVVCVYDNCSGDETAAVVAEIQARDPRVRYFRHADNIGALGNFRFGMDAVETPYFSLLSDDDILLPGFYENAMAALVRRPSARFVITPTAVVTTRGATAHIAGPRATWPAGLYTPPQGFVEMIKRCPPTWTGMLISREALAVVGGVDGAIGVTADLEFEYRLASRFPYAAVSEPGAVFYLHSGTEDSAVLYPLSSIEGRLEMFRRIRAGFGVLPAEVGEAAYRVVKRRHLLRVLKKGGQMIWRRNGRALGLVGENLRRVHGMPLFGRLWDLLGRLFP